MHGTVPYGSFSSHNWLSAFECIQVLRMQPTTEIVEKLLKWIDGRPAQATLFLNRKQCAPCIWLCGNHSTAPAVLCMECNSDERTVARAKSTFPCADTGLNWPTKVRVRAACFNLKFQLKPVPCLSDVWPKQKWRPVRTRDIVNFKCIFKCQST